MEHTPGPYTHERHEYTSAILKPSTDEDSGYLSRLLAIVYGDNHGSDARLFKAAPDLLAACETAVTLFEMDDEANTPGTPAWVWLQIARDAIAKARGGE